MMTRVSERACVMSLCYHAPSRDAPHAGGAFVYRHLLGLTRHFRVDAVLPASTYSRSAAESSSEGLPLTVLGTERPSGAASAAIERGRQVWAGVSPGPTAVRAAVSDPRFYEHLARADLVELQWSEMLTFAPLIKRLRADVPIVAVCHDVITQALSRKADLAAFPRSAFFRGAAWRSRRLEPRLLAYCSQTLVFSTKDQQLLRGLGVQGPIEVIDPDLHPPSEPSRRPKHPTALFVGAMDRRENYEGVLEFLDVSWPMVRAAVPDSRLRIVGAAPPDFLLARANEHVTVTGHVDDLDPWYCDASVFVVPLRLGAGLKFKVPQAMLYGLPVVSTSVGAEGVVDEAGPGVFAGVSDEMPAIASLVVRAMLDAEFARGVGERARTWALARFDFDRSTDRIAAGYRRLIVEAQDPVVNGR